MDEPVELLFFYADWCGLCKMLKPKLLVLEEEYINRVDFKYINIEESKELAVAYDVKLLPTLLIICQQRPLWRSVGKGDIPALRTVLEHFCS